MTLAVKYYKRLDTTYIQLNDVKEIVKWGGSEKYLIIREKDYTKLQNKIKELEAKINERNIFMEGL